MRRPALVAIVIVLAVIGCWWCWSPLGANDLVGGDEGFYGTTARNMLTGPQYVISPSFHPLGEPGDKPPLYPALLALSIRAFGPTEAAVRWPSLLFAACIALGVGALSGRASGPWAGVAAAGMLVTLPWFGDASRQVAAEIPLTALGTAALVVVGNGPLSRRRASIAGALFGLAFLCKLWLVAVIALPLLATWLPASGARISAWLALVACAALVAATQLLAVALFAPAQMAHWCSVYFGGSLAARVSGGGYAGYWLKPPGFYWGLLTHAYAPLLPLVLAGVVDSIRRFREPLPRALLLWGAGVVVLSCFGVKSGEYAYVVVPAWAALAGMGAFAMAARRPPPHWAVALAAAATFPAVVSGVGGLPMGIGPWTAIWSIFAIATVVAGLRPAWARGVAVALACGLALPGLAREASRMPVRYHAPGYRAAAAAVASRLASEPAARASFVSPETPALEYYLFRTGVYWSTPYVPWSAQRRALLQSDTTLRVFIIDRDRPSYGGVSDPEMVRWLEHSTTELAQPADGGAESWPGLRVFVRR